MLKTKKLNPKILERNKRIRKDYNHFADVKHNRDSKIMEFLETK